MASPRTDGPRYLFAIAVVGVVAALFAVAFRSALTGAYEHLFASSDVLTAFRALPVWLRIMLPALGGLAAGVVGVLAAHRAGRHGVAEILEAVSLGRGSVRPGMAALQALGTFLATVGGGSIGREGPIVQFGAGTGAGVGRWLRLDPRRVRALMAAGTAAGFAAAYNTPLAAMLFVVEIVTVSVTLELVLPAALATVVSTALTRAVIGGGPIYGLRSFALTSDRELLAFAGLGVVAGLVGPAFLVMLDVGTRAFRASKLPRPAQGALGGLVVGLLAASLPEVTGNGYETIRQMLEARLAAWTLLILLGAKAIATSASVSSGSPGGVFTPSLYLGAALGGLVASALDLFPQIPRGEPGGYVLVGMAALIAATTHAPLMASVLVFELTGDYAIVLPLFVATCLATLVARRLRPGSIYTEELRRRSATAAPVDRPKPMP